MAWRLVPGKGRLPVVDTEPGGSGIGPLEVGEPLEEGPTRPNDEVRAELEAFLEDDQSRLGQVYRALQRDLDAGAIAAELEIGTSSFVWNYERIIKAVLDGNLPKAPTVALGAARRYRSMLKSARLSAAARSYLETNLRELERRANDETARVIEIKQAQEQTQAAEARNDIGIYVYALPHYLRYPFEPDSGRTLMKVGRSEEMSGQGGAGLRDVFDEKVPRGGIKWCARKGTLCRLHGDEKGQPHGGKCNGSTNVELWKQHGPLAVLPGLAGDTIDRKQI